MTIWILYLSAALFAAMMLLRPLVHWLLIWDRRRRDRKWARRRAYRCPGFIPVFDEQYDPQRDLSSDQETAV